MIPIAPDVEESTDLLVGVSGYGQNKENPSFHKGTNTPKNSGPLTNPLRILRQTPVPTALSLITKGDSFGLDAQLFLSPLQG